MSAHPFQSLETHRPQPDDFNSCPTRPTDRSQYQGQSRGILRQPHNHRPSPRSPEFDNDFPKRSSAQQRPSADARHRDIFGHPNSLPMPRASKIDTERDSVARACGQPPSPALNYQPELYRTPTSPQRTHELTPAQQRPQAPRARMRDPRKLFTTLDGILRTCDATSPLRFRLHDCLDWIDIRQVQLRERDDLQERDRERSRFAQMRRNPNSEVDPKMGAFDVLSLSLATNLILLRSRYGGSSP
jgi:hypothetical protein